MGVGVGVGALVGVETKPEGVESGKNPNTRLEAEAIDLPSMFCPVTAFLTCSPEGLEEISPAMPVNIKKKAAISRISLE